MIYFDDLPDSNDYTESNFMRDQLQEASDEIEACYALLNECAEHMRVTDDFLSSSMGFRSALLKSLLRRVEARTLPAAQGSMLHIRRPK